MEDQLERITIPVFPIITVGYDNTHPNLDFIIDGDDKIAIMFYKLNDEPDVFVYSHGNGSDISDTNEFLSQLAYSIGINIITYDYPGYGLTSDNNLSKSEEGCVRAINSVFKYLLSKGSEPKHIILYGASLGTGPTIDLASRIPDIKGIILQTPYTRFGSFKSDCLIKNVMCPVTIIHGKMDEIIPYSHGLFLFNILRSHSQNKIKLITIDDATHNNIWTYPEIIEPAIIEMIGSLE